MKRFNQVVLCLCLVQIAVSVKVKLFVNSEQDDSKIEEEESHTQARTKDVTILPFIKRSHNKHVEEKVEYEEEKLKTEKNSRQMHPNEMIFPLIYKQNHINSMFKFEEKWYTWSIEKRTDGSKAINYYVCYDEPKRCDDIGWERTENLPRCAFQIDSLMSDDKACINSFGTEPHNVGNCDGAEQMKVSEIVKACGPRIRSLWRFVRVGRRPVNAAKPADVNSLICEDEEECFITIEYRIHHDRITFSLHEPTRGQTFKSALKRDIAVDEEKMTTVAELHTHSGHRTKKIVREEEPRNKKFHMKMRNKVAEGKGLVKERNDSAYGTRRLIKNKIKVREDVSEDISE